VAAPTCARVAGDILPAVRILPAGGRTLALTAPPAGDRSHVTFRDVAASTAVKRLTAAGLRTRFEGTGERVLWSSADSGEAPEAGSVVFLKLGGGAGTMPNLVGLSVRDAMRTLGPSGVQVKLRGGGGWVESQSPASGAKLNGSCTLTLAERRASRPTVAPATTASKPANGTEIAG
jgi:beta-lactam-binding protein with PASTA domain